MGVIAAYRRVLANGALARLLFGQFVSSIGDWLYLVALLVLIWQETQDPVTLGIIGAARIVPYILLSVPAGIAADRFDRRLILLTTDIARGVIMLLMAAAVFFDAPILVIVGLAIAATSFSAFFSPAIGTYLPSLVRDESELGPANSAWSSLENLAFFVGPAIAALLLSVGSLALAFVLNALTFGVVALVMFRLPSRRAQAEAQAGLGPAADTAHDGGQPKVGLFTALRPVARPLFGLGFLNVVVGFVWGGLGVITVLLAVEVFQVDEATGTGLLNSAIGVGGIVGAIIAGTLVLRRRQGPPLVIGALALGVGLAALGQAGPSLFTFALVAMAFASAGALLVEIVMTTLLQRIVPDAVRGRALGLIEFAYVTFYAAGAFIIPIVSVGQSGPVLLACGAAIGVAGVISLLLLGHYAIQQPPDDARRELAAVTLFAGLPPARLETAMRRAALREVKGGEMIIRQGEPADFFYVIASGTVEVSQAGADGSIRVLRQMGANEFFGEIGLLSRVPRTATVVAQSDCALVALAGAAFLELVESGQGLTSMLLDLHRGVVNVGTEALPAGRPANG